MNNKFFYQLIPQKLKTIIETPDSKIHWNGKFLKKDYLVDICHTLIIRLLNIEKSELNMSSTILREKYGNHYNYYFNFLLKHKIIKICSEYKKGVKARTYCLPDESYNNVIVYKNRNTKLLSKYKKNTTYYIEKNINIDKELQKKLIADLRYINIDIKKAHSLIENISDAFKKLKSGYAADCIKNKQIYYQFDNFGRFHTNFTTLKSEIRKTCLTINKEKVTEIDIKNSQPLFFLTIINPDKLNKEEYDLFKSLVIEGKLYDYFISNSMQNRKEIKKIIYTVLFGKNRMDKSNKLFKKLFPTIFKFIQDYKKINNYKTLSHVLQKIESDMVFNKIVSKIYTEIPSIHLFTVHDSIIFPEKHSEKVNEIFIKEMKKIIKIINL